MHFLINFPNIMTCKDMSVEKNESEVYGRTCTSDGKYMYSMSLIAARAAKFITNAA